ncbi:SGNH/GDSL hydrolase family protein [Myxococcota bacterium]|nr:SGNH/GDSL hydrolase family protein [Myxococcota bacterium]
MPPHRPLPFPLLSLALGLSALVAAGCPSSAGDDDTADDDTADDDAADDDVADDDTGPAADPDVDTYIPDGYRATSPTRVIFLGDSITAGVGVSGGGEPYADLLLQNDDEGWPEGTGQDLATLFPTVTEVIDESFGGALTIDVVNVQIPAVEARLSFPAEGETLVVMTAGGNDAQLALVLPENVDIILGNIETNLRTAAEWFLDPARFPDGVWFYATNVYEPTDGVGQSAECFFGFDFADMLPALDGGNEQMRGVAEDLGFSMVDMRGHFLGHGFYHDDAQNPWYDADDSTKWFSSDCIHPNNRGHHELRRLFYHAIDGVPFPAE